MRLLPFYHIIWHIDWVLLEINEEREDEAKKLYKYVEGDLFVNN